jgi:hypothetical protein
VWHIFFLFIYDNSRFQKYRFRKVLERLYGCSYDKLDIIYKNKKFTIEVQQKTINSVYNYYEIFINDRIAATFHQMSDLWCCKYVFKEENKRHASEVRAIVKAADKVLRYKTKPKKVKENGWNEYSYFN